MAAVGGELPLPIFRARVARALKADLRLSAVGGAARPDPGQGLLDQFTRRDRRLPALRAAQGFPHGRARQQGIEEAGGLKKTKSISGQIGQLFIVGFDGSAP